MQDRSTRFLLIRHAHVDTGPPPGRLCGWLDLPLSTKGRAQLEELTQGTSHREIPNALYTSPLTRALEVARVLSRIWQIEPLPDGAMREIGCGRLEGMEIRDVERRYPGLWARNDAQTDDEFAWPGGESYRDFRGRVVGGLRRIASRHQGARIAVVTHAGVIAQVVGTVRGRRPAEWKPDRPDPLSVTEVSWTNGSPEAVLSFNRSDWLWTVSGQQAE